jgi:protein-tyrosine phosphatase
MKTLLFLCTGNYYRSRFAEELFNFSAGADCPGWTAVSRGVAVDLGTGNVGPVARATAQALAARGVRFDLARARMPRQLEVADLDAADHIVALKEAEHRPLLRQRFADWVAASHPGRVEYWHVHDVDQLPPEEGLPLIADRLPELLRRLAGRR